MSESSSATQGAESAPAAGAETIVEGHEPIDVVMPAPTQLGRYRILERLGVGGMGVVELAYDPELDRRVALKCLRRSAGSDDAQRIQREARAVAQISHPNVVSVHDVGVHEGTVYIAMEYIEGSDLSSWFASHRGDLRGLIDVMRQAGEGLAAAHAAGLIHRDFKPSNVMVGTDGRVRVLDFGLAKLSDSTAGVQRSSGSGHVPSGSNSFDPITQAGDVMGTPLYMAPEQHASADVDDRADVYSFCLVLYEGLMGHRAFTASSLRKLVWLKTSRKYAKVNTGPRRLRTLIERGLSPYPDDRPSSMQEVLPYLHGRTRRRGMLIGLAGGLGLAGAAWAVSGNESDCDRHSEAFAGVWDADARGRLDGAFAAAGVDFGASMADRTAQSLDAYTRDWVAQRVALCEGTVATVETPRELLLAEVCMEARREEVARALEVLETADVPTMARSLEMVRKLEPAASCVELPDQTQVEAVEQVARAIADARVARTGGNFEEAERLLRQARTAAVEGDYLSGRVQADIALGSMLLVLNRTTEAEELLEAAALDAETLGDDRAASHAYLELAYAVGVRGTQFEGARRWLDLAKRKQVRKHGSSYEDPDVAVRLYEYRGLVEHQAGNFAAAEAILREGLSTAERIDNERQTGTWILISDLASSILAQGRSDEAIETYEAALRRGEEYLGRGHPQLSEVRSNLAAAYIRAGRHPEAIEQIEASIAALEPVFGPKHPTVIGSMSNLGSSLRTSGRLEEAREVLLNAERRIQDDENVSETAMAIQVNLAGLELSEGKPHLARERLARVEATTRATWGPDYPRLVNVWLKQADVYRVLEQPQQGLESIEQAIELLDRRASPSDPMRGFALLVQGQLLLSVERYEDAIVPLEASIEIMTNSPDQSDLESAKQSLAAAKELAATQSEP